MPMIRLSCAEEGCGKFIGMGILRRLFEVSQYSGARATAPSPSAKKMNINKSSSLAERGAPANSRQTKTPQQAEIMVAPWPME
jgi:hypothetical protein